MSTISKLCLGTWQFESLSAGNARELIEVAHGVGIHMFDTAAVYADGAAEVILGQSTTPVEQIVTKVPATSKNAAAVYTAYPVAHVRNMTEQSCERLGRAPTTLLLHNWRSDWENGQGIEVLELLRATATEFGIASTGISLPNGYTGSFETTGHFALVDVIEAPYNPLNPSINSSRAKEWSQRKTVLLRSLMQHGRDKAGIQSKLQAALNTGAYVVLGATKPAQINNWRELL